MIIRFVILAAASQIIIMNQQYDADVSIVNNNAMHVQTLRSFGLINTQSTEQPLQLGLGWSYAQQWKPASPQSPPLLVSCKNIGTLEHWGQSCGGGGSSSASLCRVVTTCDIVTLCQDSSLHRAVVDPPLRPLIRKEMHWR